MMPLWCLYCMFLFSFVLFSEGFSKMKCIWPFNCWYLPAINERACRNGKDQCSTLCCSWRGDTCTSWKGWGISCFLLLCLSSFASFFSVVGTLCRNFSFLELLPCQIRIPKNSRRYDCYHLYLLTSSQKGNTYVGPTVMHYFYVFHCARFSAVCSDIRIVWL